jgi:hypothetical protein
MKPQMMIRASRIGATLAVTSAAIWACSSDPSGGSQVYGNSGANGGAAGAAGGPGGSGPAGGASGSGISGIGGAISPTGGNGGTSGMKTDAACAQSTIEAKQTPLDMFIMFDQSLSMQLGNYWVPVTNALKQFVQSREMDGVGVGLGYFGLHAMPPLLGVEPGSCNANDYARPDVPIEVLPGVSQKIISSLDAHAPVGGTPTTPALQGAMQYATQWANMHTDRKTIVVLATDGEPQGCADQGVPNDIGAASMVAAQGAAANPSINTYVVGIGNVQGLNQIAQAGGSRMAYIVQGGNGQAFLDAMKQIRGIALGCEYEIPRPDGKLPDFKKVNMYHTPTGGAEGVIYHVTGPNDCGKGGWYYDLDAQGNPIGIKVCPDSCKQLIDGGGRIDIQVGCSSIPPPA